ncbi:hypothetical protein AB2B38_003965 [Balneola sp. MJW-20]|uniref:hypothetical protein n=1 Tax=Gracilimonas aurantiaca TaxID=3234185 RepID=UPI0034670DA1
MLRSTLILFISAILLVSCNSSSKLLQKGRYDAAIEKSVKKLRKNAGNDKELRVLKEAYTKANTFDREEIAFLEKEGRADNYVAIYRLYERLDYRQDRIKTLPTRLMNQFQLVNYDDELIASKEQAAEVSYNQGMEFLEAGGRQNARAAFYEFDRARNLYPNYRDVNARIAEAQIMGTNQVLFVIENNSESVLPARFDEELRKIGLAELNNQWIQYSTYETMDVDYDYFIVLNIRDIAVSPEQLASEKYTDTREIQDGMKYVLDDRGNVKKDSLGNDIRVPNMVTISAEVNETRQFKEAIVGGTLDYVDLRTDQLVKTENISVTALFEHYSATFSGDERALTEESENKVGSSMVPFPPNEMMLLDAANLLKDQAKVIIFRNRNLLGSTID